MKIVTVIGARPQFIKCGPISRKIRKNHQEILVHTGQHYDHNMSTIFFDELEIPKPDYNLDVRSAPHGQQTGKMLIRIEKILLQEKPDLVLVYGDTNSTVAGSLAAAKLNIPIAHVESGLRSFDKSMPEEINRVVTDHLSSILFCPTKTAIQNLEKEGITKGVYDVGDVMVDSLQFCQKIADRRNIIFGKYGLKKGEYILTTIHRASNTDSSKNIYNILQSLYESNYKVIFPVHPRTKKKLKEYGFWDELIKYLIVIPPLGYADMIKLMAFSRKIITDSGGMQKEAYILGIPCITIRENTEWIETVENGWNILVGTNRKNISNAIENFEGTKNKKNIFGDGKASVKISNILNQI